MRETRQSKSTDQEEAEKAFTLICQLVELNPHICTNSWIDGLLSSIACTYLENKIPYEDFCEEMDNIKAHYKHWWNDS